MNSEKPIARKRNKREIIDQEAEAVELGLSALGYMLNRTARMAVDFNHMAAHNQVKTADGRAQVRRLCQENLSIVRKARKVLGRLMEDVGNYRDATDSCTDDEGDITGSAFKAMHTLEGKAYLHAEQ